ncbi:MAG: N-acetylmuramoyl-L-alanine amidase [Terriglobales bacterium]
MSAYPTSADPATVDPATGDPGSPLQQGNLVLESIARQEAMRALLAFSELHEQIRNRRIATGREADRDLFETERFILDEVLQLICDRVQTITQADAVIVALAEESEAMRSADDRKSRAAIPQLLCRAAAGPLAVTRGVHLIAESEFLQDGLDTGRILRCDDGEIDARVELDFAHALGARSTVLVPLRGRREQIGVLQAFARAPWAFTDQDVRCFDLFAELVLSALKPEDEDRRIHWLSDVADEVLQAKRPATTPIAALAESEIAEIEPVIIPETAPAASPLSTTKTFFHGALAVPPPVTPEEPALIPAVADEPPQKSNWLLASESPLDDTASDLASDFTSEIVPDIAGDSYASSDEEAPTKPRLLAFLPNLPLPGRNLPGLSVVLALVIVAALFSAGAWWGLENHGATTVKAVAGKVDSLPASVTAPPAPSSVVSPAVADNLLTPAKLDPDSSTLTAVPDSKLAALPKITGLRHWTSSIGSTVVIDMEDQVPYEVHRLMSPERIYFDLHDTALAADLDGKTMDVGDASLTRVRIAQPVAGVTRIVLDTKDGSNFSVSMESNPYRLIVELRGSERTLMAKQLAPKAATPKLTPVNSATIALASAPAAALAVKAPDQSSIPAKTGKFRIVLDAGHGGWDLGTVGHQGVVEKDLVLDVTARLGKLLESRLGSEVVFTRTDDSYLPLEQRADIANQAQADLFVSVHANYSTSAEARGVETYYSNLFSAPGSRELEKHDDGSFPKLTPVSLSPGALHEKIAESERLAASVQRALYSTLSASSPGIRNRGIKDKPFVVLTGTTMPAILSEISFVSSPADERNLQNPTYRQQIAEALYQGISRYEQAAPHAKVAQLRTAAARQ